MPQLLPDHSVRRHPSRTIKLQLTTPSTTVIFDHENSPFLHSFSHFFICILTYCAAALHQQLCSGALVQLLIMRLPRSLAQAAILSTILFPFLASANVPLRCDHVQADGAGFTFKPLGGPRSVLHSVENSASWTNTTYTIDLCVPLKRKSDVPDDQKCPGGTQCKLFPSMLLPVALI